MNKRIIKKVAKRYLDTGVMPGRYVLGVDEYYCGLENRYYKTVLNLRSTRLQREVYAEAYRRGWDGCHWDNPLVLSVEEVA